MRVRVWIVLDGETVYIDRNGDGDLTAQGKRFDKLEDCKGLEIPDPDGRTRYVITCIRKFGERDSPRPSLDVEVKIQGPVAYEQYCGVELQASPKQAHVRISTAHWPSTTTRSPR